MRRIWGVKYRGSLPSTPKFEWITTSWKDHVLEIGVGVEKQDTNGVFHTCCVRCMNRTIKKSTACLVWNTCFPTAHINESCCFPLDKKDLKLYISHMYNQSEYTPKNPIDKVITETVSYIRRDLESLDPSAHLNRVIRETHGMDYYYRNKGVIEEAKLHGDVMQEDHALFFQPICNEMNALGTFQVVKQFIRNLKAQYCDPDHCPYQGEFQDSSTHQQIHFITLIALLPFLVKRNTEDNIPGLALWGKPRSGKSFLFVKANYYRKIAFDAPGVSRYRLSGMQTAFLLDDCTNNSLLKEHNAITIKQLALGQEAMVKIHSATQEVRAFIVITTNDRLFFAVSEEEDDSIEAWQRRFISFKFTQRCSINDAGFSVDFSMAITKYVIRRIWLKLYETLPSPMRKKFSRYVNFIEEMPVADAFVPILEGTFQKDSSITVEEIDLEDLRGDDRTLLSIEGSKSDGNKGSHREARDLTITEGSRDDNGGGQQIS